MKTIKVNISGREYPVNVPAESISAMQNAAMQVNEQLRIYSTAYAVNDRVDLLAMCALQFAFQRIENENKETQLAKNMDQKLEAIENLLTTAEE